MKSKGAIAETLITFSNRSICRLVRKFSLIPFQWVEAERDPERCLDKENMGESLCSSTKSSGSLISAQCIALIHDVNRHHVFQGMTITLCYGNVLC